MAKRSTPTLAQTERLLNLVPYIATHQNVPISDLAKEFGVSKKEILDDLNSLWMCGLPGYTPLELIDLSFDDGFVSIRNAEILEIPRSLTTSEVVALILGLDLLVQSDGAPKKEIQSLQKKLRKISGDIVRALPLVDSAYRATIQQAISERKGLAVSYFSPISDEISHRDVTPLEIHLDGSFEYLVAMTEKGLRHFRLDRVSAISVLNGAIGLPVSSQFNKDSELKVTVKILQDYRRMMEMLSIDITNESDAAASIHEVSGFSSEWFVRTVFQGAGGLELLGPENFRAEIASRATQLLELYESGELPK